MNNIAWVIRHLPIFGVFGDGNYRLAPLHVEDFARIAVRAIDRDSDLDRVVDPHGPELFTYRDLVKKIASIIDVRRPVIGVPPTVGYAISKLLNPALKDVIITREEIAGLVRGLLWSEEPSHGNTLLTEWAAAHRDELGRRYASEVQRRIRRDVAYEKM